MTPSDTPTTASTTPEAGTAGVIEAARATDEQLQLVTFELAGEEFAVDILSVHEINRMMDLTRVPQSPPDVEGVINLRGRIIPVIDLRRRFNMPTGERNEQNRIVVVEIHGQVIGFIVDRVHEVLRIPSGIVDRAPEMVCSIDSEFIRGVGKLEDRLLILLDLGQMFDAEAAAEMAA
jgi:purine-binding chemotaxis protein CheW